MSDREVRYFKGLELDDVVIKVERESSYISNEAPDTRDYGAELFNFSHHYDSFGNRDFDTPSDMFRTLLEDFTMGHNASGLNPLKKYDPDLLINYFSQHPEKAGFDEINRRGSDQIEVITNVNDVPVAEDYSVHDFNNMIVDGYGPFEDVAYDDILKMLPEIFNKVDDKHTELYLEDVNIYDHSGWSLYTGKLGDHVDARWDCTPIGLMVASVDSREHAKDGLVKDLEAHGSIDTVNPKVRFEEDTAYLVNMFNHYFDGSIYDYTVTINTLEPETWAGVTDFDFKEVAEDAICNMANTTSYELKEISEEAYLALLDKLPYGKEDKSDDFEER